MLSLPDVTLVCVFNQAHDLHRLAADECLKHARFGDVLIAEPKDYVRFVRQEMPRQIKTGHLLIIQWDSWIINPDAWTNEFLKYDYVGAPWWYSDDYNVGNSGFLLLSKRLAEFLADHEDEFPFPVGKPWDHVLCREYQPRLPQFKWAPDDLAWHFSVERTAIYPTVPFGFHGLFHFRRVLSGEALEKRLMLASKETSITGKPEWREIGMAA